MNKIYFTLALYISLIFVPNARAADTDCHLTVGVVPQFEQRRLAKVWTPILDTLGKHTGCHYELIGTSTILGFEQHFKEGKFDLVYLNPYHAVMANDAQGYEPIARSGAKLLKGILTVHKNSGITSLKELDGKQIAFPSPNALGASLLMRAELATKYGINVDPLYVKTHSSVYLHVAKQLTPAGGGVLRTLKEQKPALQNTLNILHTTTPVPAHPLVVHPRVGASLQASIQRAWLTMEQHDSTVFDGIPMKKAIATSMSDYDALRQMGLENFVGKAE